MAKKKKKEITICTNCKYCKEENKLGEEDLEYNSKCTATRLSRKSFVTGKVTRWYARCKNINTEGDCPKFSNKNFLVG